VDGKVNAISLDRCTKVGLLFGAVVSSVELVNCSGVEVQSRGGVPTFAVDASDGVQVWLVCF
jgi:adenylyl cyclase-associated protein